jgi:hypothetical protein
MAGKGHARASYNLYSEAAADVGYEARRSTEGVNRERAVIQGGLGSADQVAGTGDFASDPRVGNYASRYTMSPYGKGISEGKYGPGKDAMSGALTSANDFLAQAEEAARNGQFDVAESLRSQATAAVTKLGPNQEFLNLERDPNKGGNATLSSPIARMVGGDVRRAGELGDPNSKSYRDLYSSLTDPGVTEIEGGYTKAARTIARGLEGTEREARDMAAGRGAGRNPLGEMNLMSRIHEAANTELANARLDADIAKSRLFADSTKFMITYGDEFRRNTVQYAQDWINGAPYVRDGYVQAQQNMAQFSAQIFQQRAQSEAAIAATEQARGDARAAYYRNLIIAAGTVVASMGVGAIAGAGFLGASAASAVGGSAAAGAITGAEVSTGAMAGTNAVKRGP